MAENSPYKSYKTNQLRVHLVTDRFSLGGGIEHIYQIVNGLSHIHFDVFGEPGPAVEKFELLPNVNIHTTGYDASLVLKDSPDIVHIHHLKPLTSFFKNPFKKYKIPIIFTVHGLHIHKYEFQETVRANISYFLRFHLEKNTLKKAKGVIAVSREDREFLETYYGLTNVTYLTNGIDFSRITRNIDEPRESLRKRFDFPNDSFIFITVARFDFQKGYDILIEAIKRIKPELEKRSGKDASQTLFVFVGDGSEFDVMKRKVKASGIQPYVRFMGARTDVYDLIRSADVCLLPSRWEGLPIVLLETGLLKVPVIASDTYGNREVIGGNNGILFKNLDVDQLGKTLLNVRFEKRKDELDAFAGHLYDEIQTNYNLDKMLQGLNSIYCCITENSCPSEKNSCCIV